MEFEFEKEEMVDQTCVMCKGVGIYESKIDGIKETCSHCKGKGTTKWPKRCKGDCSICPEAPKNPLFKVGDIFVVDAPGINADGSKGIVTGVDYSPCRGNYYYCKIDGVNFGDSDANIRIRGKSILKLMGMQQTLSWG